MWGNLPHIRPAATSTGQPICNLDKKLGRVNPRGCGVRDDHGELSTNISGAMREEARVVAPRAPLARRDLRHACVARMFGDQRAKVDALRRRRRAPGERGRDIGAHLVARAADRRAQMDAQVGCSASLPAERGERTIDDSSRGAAPSGVQNRRRAIRVRDEDRYAVGNRHGHRRSAARREVAIRVRDAKPPLPGAIVLDHARAVHLRRRGEARRDRVQRRAENIPPAHHLAHRLFGVRTETPCPARRRERRHSKALEVRNVFARKPGQCAGQRAGFGGSQLRRSSTRVIRAPSARSRSSMRS